MRIDSMVRGSWLRVPLAFTLLVLLVAAGTAGTDAASSTPAAGRQATAISAGGGHTCALANDTTLWCWGNDFLGQLGDGTTGDPTTHNVLTPGPVMVPSGKLIGVKAVSAGLAHTCALLTNGTVRCWGSDTAGQLGDNSTGDAGGVRLVPVAVRNGSDTGKLTKVVAISAAVYHTCAVRTDGTVWCWGWDLTGQLGDGTTGDPLNHHERLLPVQVRLGSHPLNGVTAISTSYYSTCARRNDGTAWCWGSDVDGALGDGTTGRPADHLRLHPVQVRTTTGLLTNVKTISAGTAYACVTRTDGSAWCWGDAAYGQIGDGHLGDAHHVRLRAVRVHKGSGMLSGATSITTGQEHSCVTRSDKTAWCWGYDLYAQLGDGTIGGAPNHRVLPRQVRLGSGILTNVKALDAGLNHTCALRTDKSVWCWGYDLHGQLGDGTTGHLSAHLQLLPVQVAFAW